MARPANSIGFGRSAALLQSIVALLAAWMLLALPHEANAAPLLKWRLENSFRLFTDPADTEMHRATYKALSPQERVSPILSAERQLQSRPGHEDGWAARMYRKTCWDWRNNRYGCDDYPDYMNPQSHRVVADIAGLDEASDLSCTWVAAARGGKEGGGKPITQPCSESLFVDVPYPSGLTLKVQIGGREILQGDIAVKDILVVGIGDSFASGEGNPDVPVRFSRERAADYGKSDDNVDLLGYPARMGPWKQIGDKAFIEQNARWQDQACHRSLYSQQMRAALQLAIEDPHRAVTFVGLACSGAEVTFGLFLRYKGNEWVPNPPALSQISAAADAQCGRDKADPVDLPEAYHLNGRIPELKGGLVLRKCHKESARKIDLLYVSIGGNDVGFSRLVANAVLKDESTLRWLGGWFGEVYGQSEAQAQIVRLETRYKSLNRALHNLLYIPWDESDRIVLTDYPGMALTGDGSEMCKDGRFGMEIVPDFQLSEQKLREGTWIADKLHRLMRESAYANGWSFVETHRRSFVNRGICSGSAEDGGDIAEELRLPRKINGLWRPYNPADFRAYSTRQRWFRTPNDAFMTGNFHVATSLLTKVLKFETLQWFQLLLASTYSGAFHPTAEGHAAIADAVAEKSRIVLGKYGQGSAREAEVEDDVAPAAVDEPWIPEPDLSGGLAPRAPTPAELGQANPHPPAAEYDEPASAKAVSTQPAAPLPAPAATAPAVTGPAHASPSPPSAAVPRTVSPAPATAAVPSATPAAEPEAAAVPEPFDAPGTSSMDHGPVVTQPDSDELPDLSTPSTSATGVRGPAIGAPDPGATIESQPLEDVPPPAAN